MNLHKQKRQEDISKCRKLRTGNISELRDRRANIRRSIDRHSETKKGQVTIGTQQIGQIKVRRPHSGCPRVPVSASTAYTLGGKGGNPGGPRRTPRRQVHTAAARANDSQHCLHTRRRFRLQSRLHGGRQPVGPRHAARGQKLQAKAGEAS